MARQLVMRAGHVKALAPDVSAARAHTYILFAAFRAVLLIECGPVLCGVGIDHVPILAHKGNAVSFTFAKSSHRSVVSMLGLFWIAPDLLRRRRARKSYRADGRDAIQTPRWRPIATAF